MSTAELGVLALVRLEKCLLSRSAAFVDGVSYSLVTAAAIDIYLLLWTRGARYFYISGYPYGIHIGTEYCLLQQQFGAGCVGPNGLTSMSDGLHAMITLAELMYAAKFLS